MVTIVPPDAILRIAMLSEAPPTPTHTDSQPASTATPKPVKPEDGRRRGRVYENCDAVRAAGVAPLTRGDGVYEQNTHMDRDGDGVACE